MKYFFMKLFKDKNPLVMLVYTFWGFATEEAYQMAQAFRKVLELKQIKLKTIKLEDTLAVINAEYLAFKMKIGKLLEEYVTLNKEFQEVEYKYFNALSVDQKSEEELKANIPAVKFEEDTSKKYKASRDVNSYIFRSSVPKSHNTDESIVITGLNEDIHDMAIEMGAVSTNQFQEVSDVKPLPIVKREEPKKPLNTNKRKYFGRWSLPFFSFCLLSIYTAEAIILHNIFHNTLGFDDWKAWIASTTIVGITYIISRVLLNQSERLLGAKKNASFLLKLFAIVFFIQVFTAGILTNYNIRFQSDKQELQNVEDRLRRYQSVIADAYDPSEVAELQNEADELEAEVKHRSAELEEEPTWIIWCGYVIVGLFSVLTLFASCILKSLAEQAKHIVKLAHRRKFLSKRIAEIKGTYDTEVERLLDANVLRQLFRYHMGRKHATELLLSQVKDLDKNKYVKTYRQRNTKS